MLLEECKNGFGYSNDYLIWKRIGQIYRRIGEVRYRQSKPSYYEAWLYDTLTSSNHSYLFTLMSSNFNLTQVSLLINIFLCRKSLFSDLRVESQITAFHIFVLNGLPSSDYSWRRKESKSENSHYQSLQQTLLSK